MQVRYKKYTKDIFLLIVVAVFAIFLGKNIPHWYRLWQRSFKNGDYSDHVKSFPYKLTLYGAATCQHCQNARTYLRQAGIEFNDLIIDRSGNAAKLYQQLGEKAVPVLVSDSKMLVGFSPARYEEMLKESRVR